MKKSAILITCFVINTLLVVAQNYGKSCTYTEVNCEFSNGISTNPNNPINPQCSTMLNSFDWRILNSNPEFYEGFGPNSIPISIQNPFTGPGDAEYDPFITFGYNSNYHPEDGWELLSVNLGTQGNVNLNNDPNYVPNQMVSWTKRRMPYLILYNRYTGVIRFFATLTNYRNTFNTIRIEVKVASSTEQDYYTEGLNATNLLSMQGEAMQALDQESDETDITVFAKFTNNSQNFFWFDLPVAYDPCICKGKSQLEFHFYTTWDSDVLINGDPMKGITFFNGPARKMFHGVMAAGSIQSETNSNERDVIPGGLVTNLSSLQRLINIALNSDKHSEEEKRLLRLWQENIDCHDDFKNLAQRNIRPSQMHDFIAAEKSINANTTFLTVGMNGCTNYDNAGSKVSNYFTVDGRFNSSYIHTTQIFLAMPGSDWSNISMRLTDYGINGELFPQYPTYNERLGTFALLETPTFSYEETRRSASGYFAKLKQEGDLQYTFNPKMNIDSEKTSIFCRLVYSGDEIPNQENSFHFEHHPNGKYKLSSLFVPIEHFKNMPLIAEVYEQLDPNKIFIQFKIFAVSQDTGRNKKLNESYFLMTFPINLRKSENRKPIALEQLIGANSIKMNVGNHVFDTDVLFEKSKILAYDGKVTIAANLRVLDGENVIIYATAGFEILPNTVLHPNISLRTGYPFITEPQPQANFEFINTFCGDNSKYKAKNFKERSFQKEETPEDKKLVGIYPNPNDGVFYINFSEPINEQIEVSLLDITGREVYRQKLLPYGGSSYTVDARGITRGMYFVYISSELKTKGHKILVL